MINIVTPKYGACALNLRFSEKLSTYELSVSYAGESADALETAEDELSAMMVRGNANHIRHEYADGVNTITAVL